VIQRRFVVSELEFCVAVELPDRCGVLGVVDFRVDGAHVAPMIALCGVAGQVHLYHEPLDDARADMAWLRSDDVRNQVIEFLRRAMEMWKAEASP
jgi:hypothetical protein